MTKNDARKAVTAYIKKFYRDLAYVPPELYAERFALMQVDIDTIINQIN